MSFLADTHLHIYACHSPGTLLENGVRHLRAGLPGSSEMPCVFCLTETAADHWFDSLSTSGHRLPEDASITLLEDGRSARLTWPGTECWVIAGRQIVARERLEILALGTAETFEDGLPLDTSLERVLEADALPVLAWAPGKWLGKRGTVVARTLQEFGDRIWLGDSSLRCTLWPAPGTFRASPRPLLAGSDPLPQPGEEEQAGCYGVHFRTELDPEAPLASFRTALESTSGPVSRIGRRNSPLTMFQRLRRHAAHSSGNTS